MWTLKERTQTRPVDEVLYSGAYPLSGISADPYEDARHAAIAEVLCCIPERDFQTFLDACEGADEEESDDGECRIRSPEETDAFFNRQPLHWFIPHAEQSGELHPYPSACRVLYLAPRLEKAAWSTAIAVVAHEIAHVILGHSLFPGERYEQQENEAWALVARWGFEIEAKKQQAVNKWRHSYGESRKRKLLEEYLASEGESAE